MDPAFLSCFPPENSKDDSPRTSKNNLRDKVLPVYNHTHKHIHISAFTFEFFFSRFVKLRKTVGNVSE